MPVSLTVVLGGRAASGVKTIRPYSPVPSTTFDSVIVPGMMDCTPGNAAVSAHTRTLPVTDDHTSRSLNRHVNRVGPVGK